MIGETSTGGYGIIHLWNDAMYRPLKEL